MTAKQSRRYWNALLATQVLRIVPLEWFMALSRNVPQLAMAAVLLGMAWLGFSPEALLGGVLVALVTTDNIKYGTSTSITCTLTGLAASATVGRQCTVIDNTSNLFDDVYVTVGVSTNASTPAASKAAYVWFFGTEDLTNFDMDDAAPGASDAAYTINAASNLKGPGVISCPTASKTYRRTFVLSQFFGGIVPPKWGFVVTNDTNNAFGATAIGSSYTGITYTNT
jgi:hypothetical protein